MLRLCYSKDTKLGKNERALLCEIGVSHTDVFLGLLCSAGSTRAAQRIAQNRSIERAQKAERLAREKKARKRALLQLEKKHLIKIIPHKTDDKIILTPAGQMWAGLQELEQKTKNQTHPKWNGQWTLIMFDMPTNYTSKRIAFVSILKRIGFIQVQMSNYVFPHDVPGVEKFIKLNPSLGEYCHVFRGEYKGDDSGLQKNSIYKLSPQSRVFVEYAGFMVHNLNTC